MLLESSLARRSNLARKGIAYGLQVPRTIRRLASRPADFRVRPPIIVNSLPKSGTHLLMQVARSLPNGRYYGSFLAQTPSLTMRLRTQPEIDFHIGRIVPGEVVGAHLHYTEASNERIKSINALHLFIYRDPRDVLLSEAHYLGEMNRWHALHKIFAEAPSQEAGVTLAINGSDDPRFPGVVERYSPYAGWLQAEGALAIRYEDAVGPARDSVIERVLQAWRDRGGRGDISLSELTAAIDPGKSHTFRSGGVEKWRNEMSGQNRHLFATTSEVLVKLFGYGTTEL